MTVDNQDGDPMAAYQAASWLERFGDALDRSDAAAATALFLPDGHWRDIVAFTWHLHTFTGADQIGGALEQLVPEVAPHDFTLDSSAPPRIVRRAGVSVNEALFHFRTAHGTGRGVVRLVEGVGNDVQAWTLLTSLHELAGNEERTGDLRPHGTAYSRSFGGANWLDQRKVAIAYADRDPAVLVVGGGQAGLAIAARLNQLDVDTLVIDRMDRIGDVWRMRYHSLALHNQTWVNHLPYMPFPDSWPVFVPKDKLANWFESYVEAMEINFWTGTELSRAVYDDEARHWSVVLRRADGEERVMQPRHIVMATGVSGIPSIPSLTGLDDFAGEVLHSSAYVDGSAYRGKHALVIGTGNSGHDVAQDLHGAGARVHIVQRSSTTVVNVEPTAQWVYAVYADGAPTDVCDLIVASVPYPMMVDSYKALTLAMQEEDKDLIDRLTAVGFRTDSGEDGTGFQMKYLRRGGGYYLNVGCSDLIADREIGLIQQADIDRFVAEGARLQDGSIVPADVVVLATGYRSQQELVRLLFGDAVANEVGPVWGFDEGGELRNMWKRTPQEGLWFHAGSLAQSRIFSRFLALQIKACEEGIIDKALPNPEALQEPAHCRQSTEPVGT